MSQLLLKMIYIKLVLGFDKTLKRIGISRGNGNTNRRN